MSCRFANRWMIWMALGCLLGLAAGCGDKKDETKPEAAVKSTEEPLPEGLTPEQAAKVVAKVGERTITVGDVTRQINKLSPYIRRRWAAPEKRQEFLDKLIRVELLSQEAERQGLSNDPEVQRTVKQVMIRLFVKNDLEKQILPSQLADTELKADYDKNIAEYQRPAQIRASQIVVGSKAEAVKLIAELKTKDKDPRFFRQKAREASKDEATKERGGDLGYFSKVAERREDEPKLPAAVVEAAWNLKEIGDLTQEPVQSDKGFAVVKLINKRPEMNRSFESVKRIIENRLLRDKRREAMDKYIADLKTKAKVEMFPDNLAKIQVDTTGADPSLGAPGMGGMMPPGAPGMGGMMPPGAPGMGGMMPKQMPPGLTPPSAAPPAGKPAPKAPAAPQPKNG